jgi:phage I-like protein
VKWTARAAQLIADLEYRYLSPVFFYDEDKTGRVQQSAACLADQ